MSNLPEKRFCCNGFREERRRGLEQLRQFLAARYRVLDSSHKETARAAASAGFQLEEVEYALRRLEGGHGNS